MLLYHSLAAALPLLTLSAAQTPGTSTGTFPPTLVGTWSTKSNKTLTGPGFYDAQNERLIEPSHTGISYSFTSDGFYEEAYYRAISNPVNPSCPGGIMQWQHGQFEFLTNGSLVLNPFPTDGRQLMSQPCKYSNAVYTRYNQTELFQRFSVYNDPYHNIPRLDLFQFNGAPLQPMYLVMSPPQMLPTSILHPVSTATGAASGAPATGTAASNAKRSLDRDVPLNWKTMLEGKDGETHIVQHIDADRLWWIGLAMTGVGGLLYLGPRRMGLQLFGPARERQRS